jgi:hypothetical protein
MSLSLVDELTQKQAQKFQLNSLNNQFIDKVISENNEGIFYLSSSMDNFVRNAKMYMTEKHKDYEFELTKDPTNYEIMFKKKEVQN